MLMLKRVVVMLCLGSFLLPLGVGCMTNRPVIWSWPHNKRRLNVILQDFHELHMDFDRIIFDMDERPLEDID
jgi:hypothetical protein